MTAPTPVPPVDVNIRIGQYVQLRDKIADLDKAHKEKMRPYRDALEQLNNVLLDVLNKQGGESISTENGSAYKTEKKSASVADGKVFWDYIVANQAWDLIDKKANVTEMSKLLEEGKPLPPGINMSSRFVVGVRRK